MSGITRSLITYSLGDSGYGRAVENIGVMREELIILEMPELYNDMIIDLRKKLLGGELGGDRRDLWFKLRGLKLGLVTKDNCELSDVTEEQAAEVSDVHALTQCSSSTEHCNTPLWFMVPN